MEEMQRSEYIIRSLGIGKVTPENLAEVVDLLELVWWDHFPGIISKKQIEYMLSMGYTEKIINEELQSGIINWVTLFYNDEIVGVASYGPADNEEEMQLHKLYVHPHFQRTGYGSTIMHHLQEEATGKGYKYIMLTVNRNNHNAISAYQKNVFIIIGSRLTDIGSGFSMDDYIMRKNLF